MTEHKLQTKREELAPITATVQAAIETSGIQEGICLVYCPHTTAGITINENADPDVARDMLYALGKISPDRPEFQHMEGNSAAHVKASLVGSSATLPVHRGKLVLGTWQGIYFCEFDGPRSRRFYVQAIAGL